MSSISSIALRLKAEQDGRDGMTVMSLLYKRTSILVTTNLAFGEQPTSVIKDDDRVSRSTDSALPYRGGRKRELAQS
jgi:hypothetical protein